MHVTITYLLISSHFFLPYLRIRFNDDYPYAFGIFIVYHSTFCGCMWCKLPIGLSNYVVINYWDLKQIPHKLGSVNDETVSLESRMWAESELMNGLLDNCLPFDHKCVWFQFNLKHSKKKESALKIRSLVFMKVVMTLPNVCLSKSIHPKWNNSSFSLKANICYRLPNNRHCGFVICTDTFSHLFLQNVSGFQANVWEFAKIFCYFVEVSSFVYSVILEIREFKQFVLYLKNNS